MLFFSNDFIILFFVQIHILVIVCFIISLLFLLCFLRRRRRRREKDLMNPIELGLISVQQHDEDELDASKKKFHCVFPGTFCTIPYQLF